MAALPPIQPDDYFRLRILQDAALSPDGAFVAYSVLHTDTSVEPPVDRKTIYLQRIETGYTKQLTDGSRQDASVAWSPNGRQLAFVSDRAGKPQIFVLPVDGGEARQVTKLPQGVGSAPVWSPDGKTIAFTAGAQDDPADPSLPYRFTRHIYRFDAMGRTDRANQNVWLVDAAGENARQLTDDSYHYTNVRWSPDGSRLLVIATLGPDSHQIDGHLRLLAPEGDVQPLAQAWGSADSAEWTPDGQAILFAGTPAGTNIGTQNGLWRVNAAGGEPVNLTAGLPFHVAGRLQVDMPSNVRSPRIVCAGDTAFVRVQCGGEGRIYRVAMDGSTAPAAVVEGERFCEVIGVAGDRLLFWANGINDPLNLYTKDIASGEEAQLTRLNDELLGQRALPTVQRLLFPGDDGQEVEGWLLAPPNATAPYPGFLYIHGGPHSAFGYGFHFDFQMLAGAGYGVLFINHRASTGYGDAFATAIKGDWGHLEGPQNVSAGDYFTAMTGQSYLWSYGCGPGWWDNSFGVGTTQQFATSNLQGVFSILFGSYFGDFDCQNNFMRASMATGRILTSCWAGYPNWFLHHMGLGETIGFEAVLTQNNGNNHYEPNNPNAGRVHIALMGDPTLRMHMVGPPGTVACTFVNSSTATVTWGPSADAVLGYNVYRYNNTTQAW